MNPALHEYANINYHDWTMQVYFLYYIIVYNVIYNITSIELEPNGHVRFVANQSENDKYNLISIWFNKISKRFIYAE